MSSAYPEPSIQTILDLARESLAQEKFIKLTLGHYAGAEPDLKQILVRRVVIKQAPMLGFTFRFRTRDITKNFILDDGLAQLSQALTDGFRHALLCTLDADITLDQSAGKNAWRLRTQAPTHTYVPDNAHDRAKNHALSKDQPYLHDLGITTAEGTVRKDAQDKFRQINKYIEIMDGLVADLPKREQIRIVDMGSGKGYLTFALHDHLSRQGRGDGRPIHTIGVECRAELVRLCTEIAEKHKMEGLSFVRDSIASYDAKDTNVLIALHACDTATDDALAKGIAVGADLIVVAPCCHKQIRAEMERIKPVGALAHIVRHGIFMERQAEMATDALRALLLEYAGYKVKVFEFIGSAHTAKNVMITAVRTGNGLQSYKAAEIVALKEFYGIKTHALETRIGFKG